MRSMFIHKSNDTFIVLFLNMEFINLIKGEIASRYNNPAIAKTILDIWEIEAPEIPGESFKKDILL